MAESPSSGVNRDPLVSRAHVEQVLGRVGLDAKEIAAALDGVEFPARISRILQLTAGRGIEHEHLIDRMGGSP